jgi:hypothetical protein
MIEDEFGKKIFNMMDKYCHMVEKSLDNRWNLMPVEIFESEVYAVIGGLLSRQATMSIELAKNPGIWNGHIAPLVLRSMVDTHITLAWILTKDYKKRAKQFIDYGLGQEKKLIEHLKTEDDADLEVQDLISKKEQWLESQKYAFLTDVDVGQWSGKNTRQMAKETDLESLYKFAYEPFSAASHSMWQHISTYNLVRCQNPLHKDHLVPKIISIPLDDDYVFKSSKYLSKSFSVVDNKFSIKIADKLPVDWYEEEYNDIVEELNRKIEAGESE